MKICKRRADVLGQRREERGISGAYACAKYDDELYRSGMLDSFGSSAG
jgi:hypothetical protein